MNTPICDFVESYIASGGARLHMPGHKGRALLGPEPWDITEIAGADSLYAASGIIRESERSASRLFGTGDTLYSAEGSSQCVRAMLYLAALGSRAGRRPTVIAGRNAHKSFLTAAALLDLEVSWLLPEGEFSLCRCQLSPAGLERALVACPEAAAVYLTSPDYLGNCLDIPALAAVCHAHNVPLLVDDAHGAYRKFLPASGHPIDQGADICCDSAHKTLPVLTGGAYLHISKSAPAVFRERAREAMAMFGSTSPSYLILQSLDRANLYIADGYPQRLAEAAGALGDLKARLRAQGWEFGGDEPMKLSLAAKRRGYTGGELGAFLEDRGIVPEYADPDWLVLMLTPENGPEDLVRLEQALGALPRREPVGEGPPELPVPERVMSIREAMFSRRETVPLEAAAGRVAAGLPESCPPAIAPVVPGERVTAGAVEVYRYYNISEIGVVADPAL